MNNILSFLAAMLLSVSAFAQSESTLKGDVNEDGKVDVADINAIIKIMKDAGGTAEAPTYYWYVGQTDPSTMSSISPIVTDMSSPGWRLTGNSLNATYSYDTDANPITENPPKFGTFYIALPQNTGLSFFNVLNADCIANGTLINSNQTVTFKSVTYNIYLCEDTVEFTGFKLRNK